MFYIHVFTVNMFLLTLCKDGTGNGCTKLAGTHLISQTCYSLFTEVLLLKLKAVPSECLLFTPDPLKCKNYCDTFHPLTSPTCKNLSHGFRCGDSGGHSLFHITL